MEKRRAVGGHGSSVAISTPVKVGRRGIVGGGKAWELAEGNRKERCHRG